MSTFKDFWDKNYQWVLGALGVSLSWAISGVIGFYTAISVVDSDIDVLRDKLTKTETRLIAAESTLKGQSEIESRLKTLEGDFKYVKSETDKMSNTNSSIQYLIEVERSKTVNDLKEILKK